MCMCTISVFFLFFFLYVSAVCDVHLFLQAAVTDVDQRVALFINLTININSDASLLC